MLKYLFQYPGLLTGTSDTRSLFEKERYSLLKLHFAVLSIVLLLGAYAVGGGLVMYSLVVVNIIVFYLILRDMQKEMAQLKD
ncbi:MAG: hypothetical protein HYT64_02595 [Candidatus Yanofskybacteria bacterium]|nr:hypothetical protein [Candidatus Yanofskybacteria bacterium]